MPKARQQGLGRQIRIGHQGQSRRVITHGLVGVNIDTQQGAGNLEAASKGGVVIGFGQFGANSQYYVRFGHHDSLIEDLTGVDVHRLDASLGFEHFASEVHKMLTDNGFGAFYVFDSLTSLLYTWRSDLAVGNFFRVTCPYLFELDTIAYFPLLRNRHTYATVAGIRETTQVLLDLHHIDDALYVHPLKVWQRHSPTMFFPHRLAGGQALSITSSAATTQLFSSLARRADPPDVWQRMVEDAWNALDGDARNEDAAAASLEGNPTPALAWDIAVHHADLHEALGKGRPAEEFWKPVAEAVAQRAPEQVRDVARKYLTDDRLTVATLEPLPLDGRRMPAPDAAVDHAIR